MEDQIYQNCKDGMFVSDLRKRSCVKFINELRENQLILITRKGKIKLTTRGKIARNMGLSNYLKLDKSEKDFLCRETSELRSENVGLMMVFGGLLLSFVFVVGYWFFNF